MADIDFLQCIVHPAVQYPAEALKTEASLTSVPIPGSLALVLSAYVKAARSGETLLTDDNARRSAFGNLNAQYEKPAARYRTFLRASDSTT